MMSFTTWFASAIILTTISLGDSSSDDDGDINNCQFGESIETFQRSFDTLTTSDCSCNNYNVQYKLNQIAMGFIQTTGILSANRHDAELSECATTKFTSFGQNFFDENLFYKTSLGTGGLTWNSLTEFLFDGNNDASSFTDLVSNSDDTLIISTSPGVITDCTIDGNTETVTLNSLFTFYRRPDDDTLTDSIERSFATFEFTRTKVDAGYKYLVTSIIFLEGTRFSINNAPRTGTDTEFTTFECEDFE